MVFFHIVTPGIYPQPGGLQRSVHRITEHLLDLPNSRAAIYLEKQQDKYPQILSSTDKVEIEDLRKSVAAEPLLADEGPQLDPAERFRIPYALLRSSIAKRCARLSEYTHIILSFFAAECGFIAQQVASALSLPHVANLRGSDFELFFRSPSGTAAMQFIVDNATAITTVNQEQARIIRETLAGNGPITTIHNALPHDVPSTQWRRTSSNVVRVVSDCEFMVKKGTHILLRAAARLRSEGLPIELSVAGRTEARAPRYWKEIRAETAEKMGRAVEFHDHLPPNDVESFLLSGDIYASATLGEGCSNSRMLALVLGMPIVTTACGALPEIASGCSHVRLAEPTDDLGFESQLRKMIQQFLNGSLTIDDGRIQQWRNHFSIQRERQEWQDFIGHILKDAN